MLTDIKRYFNFESIGLEKRDKRVYEALLETPQASLRKLADNTNINRGSVYESVKRLMALGLVASVQVGKQQRYIAQHPSIILELLRERQRQSQLAETNAEGYIRQLSITAQNSEPVPSLAVSYIGDEGVAAILRDVLMTLRAAEHKHYCVISSKRIRQYMYANFKNYTQQRIKEHIEVSVIAIGEGGIVDELSDRRWLPIKEGSINCYTIIYGTKTAFITLNDENVLSGIVIDNIGVTNLQKQLFEQMWSVQCTAMNS